MGGSGGRSRWWRACLRALALVVIVEALLSGLLATATTATAAAVIVVTTTTDVVDPSDGLVSLREAVALTNTQAGDDTILLAPNARYELTLCASGDGTLILHAPSTRVTIQGQGSTIAKHCVVTQPFTEAVVSAREMALSLHGLTVEGGGRGIAMAWTTQLRPALVLDHVSVVGAGATCVDAQSAMSARVSDSRVEGCGESGIMMASVDGTTLELVDSEVTGVRVESAIDGRSHSIAAVETRIGVITRSSIHDNPGGGLLALESATITDSHIDRNGSPGPGVIAGHLVAVDSTIDDNVAYLIPGRPSVSAGLMALGPTSLTRVSVSGNRGAEAGIRNIEGVPLTITDSHVDGNRSVDPTGLPTPSAGIIAGSPRDGSPPGAVQITRTSVDRNTAANTAGLASNGPVTIADSTIAGNRADAPDPAVQAGSVVVASSLTMSGSTVSDNAIAPRAAATPGKPAAVVYAETGTLQNDTVSGNRGEVGGVHLRDGGSLAHVTLADNVGTIARHLATAGPLEVGSSAMDIGSSPATPACAVVSDPEAAGGASFVSAGSNVVADATCPLTAADGDLKSAGDLALGPLASNGGPTATRVPMARSPLRDRIQTAAGASLCGGTDQRGVSRPQGAGCDAGAVEAMGSRFHALAPSRVLDTRTNGVPGFSGPLVAGVPKALTVTGGAVPANASAVVVNVTATGSTKGSLLTVWPAGGPQPTASSVNFGAGQTIPNLITAKVGANGQVLVATNTGQTDVVVDLFGYFDDGTGVGDGWTGIAPARVLDSRGSTGGWNGPLAAGAPREVTVRGVAGIPAGATAIVANVTATAADANSFLTVWPAGGAKPTSSNVNFAVGETIANGVVVRVGANGKIAVANAHGNTAVVVDVTGYFLPGAGSRFFAVAPSRVLDDRVGVGASGPWQQGQTRAVTVTGGPIAANAVGVAANMTVTNGTRGSFLSVFPQGAPKPVASTINFGAGQTVANQTMVRIAGGKVDVFNQLGTVDVVADVVGYYWTEPT